MQLEEMLKEYELMKLDLGNTKSKLARSGIGEKLRKLKDKINDEERRGSSIPQIVDINGTKYEVPTGFGFYQKEEDQYTYEVKDNNLYRFEKIEIEPDKNFHSLQYVWIPQKRNKFANLCVRILGGDRFGERFQLSVNYYKHPSDMSSYLHKHISTNNYAYKPVYSYVFEKLGLKRVKDHWGSETNKLEWINEESQR